MEIIDQDGCQYVLYAELENHIQRNVYSLVKMCEGAKGISLDYNDQSICLESLIKFLKWFKSEYTQDADIALKLLRTLQRPKREYSTTHRIEIAYKSKYLCNSCQTLLPPTFEIDHIVEIRDGGKDEYSNLQALCPNCHAEKTRANTLKRNRVFKEHFSKKAARLEKDAFAKFYRKPTSESKYFNSD